MVINTIKQISTSIFELKVIGLIVLLNPSMNNKLKMFEPITLPITN